MSIDYQSLLQVPQIIGESRGSYTFVTEHHLQAIWLEQKYFHPLVDSYGIPIKVISPGIWNAEAGPDFKKAHLIIDNQVIKGDVEIHLTDEGWVQHHHDQDSRYNDVVLHISLWKPRESKPLINQAIRTVPKTYFQDALRIPLKRIIQLIDLDLYPYKQFVGSGRCAHDLFQQIPQEKIQSFFQSAAKWRLMNKMTRLQNQMSLTPSEPNLYLLAGMARVLGYKHNADAFSELFNILYPHSSLGEHALTAIGLGITGFFKQQFVEKWTFSSPYDSLHQTWKKYQLDFPHNLPLILHNIRPLNHPIRRIALLSYWIIHLHASNLYHNMLRLWENSRTLGKQSMKDLFFEFLHLIPSGDENIYWSCHYTFESQPSLKKLSLAGESLRTNILINVFFPILHHHIITNGIQEEQKAFYDFYHTLKTEDSGKIQYLKHRFFGSSTKNSILNSAIMQQGALQLHHDFCLHYEASCEGCPFIERYHTQFPQISMHQRRK